MARMLAGLDRQDQSTVGRGQHVDSATRRHQVMQQGQAYRLRVGRPGSWYEPAPRVTCLKAILLDFRVEAQATPCFRMLPSPALQIQASSPVLWDFQQPKSILSSGDEV